MKRLACGGAMLALSFVLLGGCSPPPAVPATGGVAPTQKYQIVYTDKALEKLMYVSVADATWTADGRMIVRANLQNKMATTELRIQVRTVFTDEQGFSTGDETPWKYFLLPRGSIITYSVTAMNDKAKNFHVEIRAAENRP